MLLGKPIGLALRGKKHKKKVDSETSYQKLENFDDNENNLNLIDAENNLT